MGRKLKFTWLKGLRRRSKKEERLLDEELLKRIVRLSIETNRHHRGTRARNADFKVIKGGKE